jgi:hypothetical protein
MSIHVVTARIYTGHLFYLGKVASGLLGGWFPKVADAEQFHEAGKADRTFDVLISYLTQPVCPRSIFDPCVLSTLYDRARVAEFGVACVEGDSLTYHRRRALNLMPLIDPLRNQLARRPAAA